MLALCAATADAAGVTLSLDSVETQVFSARAITAELGQSAFSLRIGELSALGRTWSGVRVVCREFRLEREIIECRNGVADVGRRIPVTFVYRPAAQVLELTAAPGAGHAWRLHADLRESSRRAELSADGVPVRDFALLMPSGWPGASAGTVSANIVIEGAASPAMNGTIAVRGAALSDPSGLHAGEKLDASLRFAARAVGGEWQWHGTLAWTGGEVYWQPVYLRAAGQALRAEGTLSARRITVSGSSLTLPGVGEFAAQIEWDREAGRVASADLRSGRLDAAAVYERLLQPQVAGTALAALRVAGACEVAALTIRDSRLVSVELALHELSFEDRERRFALFGLNGRIPWHNEDETRVDLSLRGGEVLRLPFGAIAVPLAMRGQRFRLESVDVPVLDGKLTVRGFATDPPGGEGWRWAFSGTLSPVSMERVTQAFGWPTMHGDVSAEIPRIAYEQSTLSVGGALVFRVFDGIVEARNLKLADPFGRAPRLSVDLDMKQLDLDLLTRTFSFGKVTGRVDARVAGLELVDWHPVRFNASIASSEGAYSRKISQSAVENITALGGAGASAALRRTFLRFFEQFSYERLGLTCRLENNVCRMGGIENTQQGYTIVKGSGIPALSVIGYNRLVDWPEFVERLKRVVRDEVHAVVQ